MDNEIYLHLYCTFDHWKKRKWKRKAFLPGKTNIGVFPLNKTVIPREATLTRFASHNSLKSLRISVYFARQQFLHFI